MKPNPLIDPNTTQKERKKIKDKFYHHLFIFQKILTSQ